MPLVLAIESDRRQADQLAALISRRLAVELVQATSAGEALQVLGERVPDLILTSPLLSPFDEAVLSEFLREIGPAGAHVQTLRIPVLSVTKPTGRSLFSFGRKRRTDSAPDGCDPTLFVDEVAVYLARAEEERQAVEASLPATVQVPAEPVQDDEHFTYVAAYDPEPHVPLEVTADFAEDQWRVDEIPIYAPPASTDREDAIDGETVSAAIEEIPFTSRGDEPDIAHDPVITAPEHLFGGHALESTSEDPPLPAMEQLVAVTDVNQTPPHSMFLSADFSEDLGGRDVTTSPVSESSIEQTPTVASASPGGVAASADARAPVAPARASVTEPAAPAVPAAEASNRGPAAPDQDGEDSSTVARAAALPPPRRSASFEAALAAIRNAWGNKRRAEPARTPVPSGSARAQEAPTPLPGSAPTTPSHRRAAPPPSPRTIEAIAAAESADDSESDSNDLETRGPLEVDLTGDIEALDSVPLEATAPATTDDVATADEDVYELSASPALHDLEDDLTLAAPSRAARPVPAETEPEETQGIEAPPAAVSEAGDTSGTPRNRPNKPQPAQPATSNTRPVQDEWGMFDPNRCGFAAVVQKLNEVTDEEDQMKGTRTSVRLISFR